MSTIEYKYKEDVGIELATSLNSTGGSNNVYRIKISDCTRYFYLSNYIKYIGYISDQIFIIVNLQNKELFSEEFKAVFSFIDRGVVDFLKNPTKSLQEKLVKKKETTKFFLKIPNFIYFEKFPPDCLDFVTLDAAKNKLNSLNNILKCINFKINIDYVFDMKENTEISAYEFNGTTLLLCIFNENNCVSSLVIKYKNREIYFDSKTRENFEGNKLNKLLRATIIIIAKDLFEECVFVTSSAINPTSAYLMINYFNAIPFDENNNPISTPLNDYKKVKEYFVAHDGGLESKTELTEVNVAKAKEVFMGIANFEIKCKKMEERGEGGKKRGEKEKKKKAGRKTRKRKIKKSRKQISKKTNYSSNR